MIRQDEFIELAQKYGTPLYIFDIEELKKRVNLIKDILGKNVDLCYAIKANTFVVKYVIDLVEKLEVCSPGEYMICENYHCDSEMIVLSGVYKKREDIESLKRDGFNGVYTIESYGQLKMLYELYSNSSEKPHILIRVSNGNQFGIDKKEIETILQDNIYIDRFQLDGIQYFTGTQKKKIDNFKEEIEELVEYVKYLENKFKIKIKNIEYGPGLYVEYFKENQDELSDLVEFKKIIERYEKEYHFIIELGRYVSAYCGYYLTQVVDCKTNNEINYCIVDGGMHQITYYGQLVGLRNPIINTLSKGAKKQKYTICGCICSTHDVLAKNIELSELCVGDILCFEKCGAYSATESHALFLSRTIPKVVIRDRDFDKSIREEVSMHLYNMETKA